MKSSFDDRRLTEAEFQGLAEMPEDFQWEANIDNPNTRSTYGNARREFRRFLGIVRPEEYRLVTRAHILAWRAHIERKSLKPSSIRNRLSAISSLYKWLCDHNFVTYNPLNGVKRPRKESGARMTPILSDKEIVILLDAPASNTIIGLRDRAILALGAYEGLRVSEVCHLAVKDLVRNQGLMHIRLKRKGGKQQLLVLAPTAEGRINEYLSASGHGHNPESPLFLPTRSNSQGITEKIRHMNRVSFTLMMKKYAKAAGVYTHGLCFHSLRATAATKANEVGGDMKAVQEMLGHSAVSTTE